MVNPDTVDLATPTVELLASLPTMPVGVTAMPMRSVERMPCQPTRAVHSMSAAVHLVSVEPPMSSVGRAVRAVVNNHHPMPPEVTLNNVSSVTMRPGKHRKLALA